MKILWFVVAFFSASCCFASDYSVVDGDSLEKGRERLRILDIDAPEFLQKCADASNWKYRCGYESGQYLRQLMVGNVVCEAKGKDRYGRTLADCYRADGLNIGREMVLQGWAVAYSDRYQKEERAAKAAKRGIWQGKFMRPELYRALQKRTESRRK